MFVNPLPAKTMDNAMTTSLRTTSLTAHAQKDTLVRSAKQVICGKKMPFFSKNFFSVKTHILIIVYFHMLGVVCFVIPNIDVLSDHKTY